MREARNFSLHTPPRKGYFDAPQHISIHSLRSPNNSERQLAQQLYFHTLFDLTGDVSGRRQILKSSATLIFINTDSRYFMFP